MTVARQGPALASFCYACTCTLLMVAYLLTMPPGYTFEETSILSAACASFGIAHPPGHPLYVLGCAPFALLAEWTGFNSAVGVAWASAAAATAACGVLVAILRRMGIPMLQSCSVAIAFGLSLSLWSQAIIQQTHALHVLLFGVALLLADGYGREGGRRKLYALAAVLGLGMSNNWPLFLLSMPVSLMWLLPARRSLAKDLGGLRWAACVGAFLLGLLPYLHMAFPHQAGSTFLGIVLPDEFLDYAVRGQYSTYLEAEQHPRWDERHLNALLAVATMLKNMTWLGGALGVVGIVVAAKKWPRWQLAALLWGLASTTYVLGLYRPYGIDAELARTHFRSAALTAHFLFAIAVATGLSTVMERIRGVAGDMSKAPLSFALSCMALLLPALALALHFGQVDRSRDDVAMRYASLVFDEVEPSSLLLVSLSSMDYPLLYDSYIREGGDGPAAELVLDYLDRVGPRPDIGQLSDYLGREERAAAITAFVPYDLRRTKFHGTYFTVGAYPIEESIEASDQALEFLLHAASLRDASNSAATRSFVDRLVFRYSLVALLLEGVEDLEVDPRYVETMEALGNEPGGRYARFLIDSFDLVDAGDVDAVIAGLDEIGDMDELPAKWQVDALSVLAQTQVQAGETEQARLTLERALQVSKNTSSTVVPVALLALLAHEGNFEGYARLRKRHPELDPRLLAGSDAQCRSNLGVSCAP